ncbi:MAG: ferredoxin [Jatrophihabitans sp.]|uniref:ferredoxin n=1 Tax=Jatrophihabitans sp. TaxID=1932789 RepID=UPI003F7F3722
MTGASPIGLRWDAAACDGVGICLHLADRLLTVDAWGFPIVPRRPLTTRADQRAARAAARACPRRALFLVEDDPAPS